MSEKRDTFSSKLGFIITTIGFSVGVGTLWRFPYVCGTYGGGLFLLTYIIFMLAIGIPLFSSEITLGLASRKSPVGAYKTLAPGKPWFVAGYFHMLCIIFVISYTIPVYAWILHYIYAIPAGKLAGMESAQVGEYFGNLIGNHKVIFPLIALNIALNMLVVRKNLQKGIERICKILLPGLACIMIVLIFVGFNLPNSSAGLKFFFTLDFEHFTFQSVLVALGQTFFSLGVGMAVAIIFGSYQKEGQTNTVKSAATISISVIVVAIMSGMMIFPMAAAFGLDLAGGPGLTFVTMPNVFNQMTAGVVWGTLFYIAFYIAAFSSSIAGWEAVMAFLMDEFKVTRQKALWITCALVAVVGIPATLDMGIFEKFDWITNNIFLVAGAFMMAIFVGWFWGLKNLFRYAGIENQPMVCMFITLVVKYVAPLIIIALSWGMLSGKIQ